MAKRNYPECVLCDTRYTPDYDDYLEYCEINEKEPEGEHSDDYWDYVYDMQNQEWEDLELNLMYSKINDCPVVITGYLGLWNGNPSIKPVRCESILEAIKKCSRNVNDVKVVLKKGHINVYGYHHDGTNCFEIHKLSKKGQELFYERTFTGYPELKPYHLAKFHDYLF